MRTGAEGEVAGDFVDDEIGQLVEGFAEELVVGVAVAEDGELVLDEGVLEDHSDVGVHGAFPPWSRISGETGKGGEWKFARRPFSCLHGAGNRVDRKFHCQGGR
jgi:hypothetical protein